jgi:ADP-ribose pyrophosphatase YjhB (NUDIX family)
MPVTDAQQTPPMAHPRVAAGALFFDDQDRIMLVQPAYKDMWEIPGGYVEPSESPLAACIREVHEELGIKPPIGQLLVVDWAPNQGEGDKMLFVFDGGRLSAEDQAQIRLESSELRSYAFYDAEDLVDMLIPRLARRLILAVSARQQGRTLYAEHGSAAPALPN